MHIAHQVSSIDFTTCNCAEINWYGFTSSSCINSYMIGSWHCKSTVNINTQSKPSQCTCWKYFYLHLVQSISSVVKQPLCLAYEDHSWWSWTPQSPSRTQGVQYHSHPEQAGTSQNSATEEHRARPLKRFYKEAITIIVTLDLYV